MFNLERSDAIDGLRRCRTDIESIVGMMASAAPTLEHDNEPVELPVCRLLQHVLIQMDQSIQVLDS